MSTSDADEGALEGALRTVTPLSAPKPNLQMNVFGYLVAIPIALLLLPLLPIALVLWVLLKGARVLRG